MKCDSCLVDDGVHAKDCPKLAELNRFVRDLILGAEEGELRDILGDAKFEELANQGRRAATRALILAAAGDLSDATPSERIGLKWLANMVLDGDAQSPPRKALEYVARIRSRLADAERPPAPFDEDGDLPESVRAAKEAFFAEACASPRDPDRMQAKDDQLCRAMLAALEAVRSGRAP